MSPIRASWRRRAGGGLPRVAPALALVALCVSAASSCGAPTAAPEVHEETHVAAPEVPQVVQDKGVEVARRLGRDVRCSEWLWDSEDSVWECVVSGLPRGAEIDVTPEGRFSELELVLDYAELREAVPSVADMLVATCKEPEGTLAELSLRAEALARAEPRLASIWGQNDVFLEIQCPDGHDFEVDPFGALVTTPDDDVGPE